MDSKINPQIEARNTPSKDKLFDSSDKKSFILYKDLIHTISILPDDIAGKVFKSILNFVNDIPDKSNILLVNVVLEPIKQSLVRDHSKYQEVRLKRSTAGKKGGRPKNQNEAIAFQEKQTKANKADSGNGSDKETEPVNANEIVTSFNFKEELIKMNIEESLINDWLIVREAKNAVNTQTAMNKILNEIRKCSLRPQECVELAVEKSWAVFNASWVDTIYNSTTKHFQPNNDNSKKNEEWIYRNH